MFEDPVLIFIYSPTREIKLRHLFFHHWWHLVCCIFNYLEFAPADVITILIANVKKNNILLIPIWLMILFFFTPQWISCSCYRYVGTKLIEIYWSIRVIGSLRYAICINFRLSNYRFGTHVAWNSTRKYWFFEKAPFSTIYICNVNGTGGVLNCKVSFIIWQLRHLYWDVELVEI